MGAMADHDQPRRGRPPGGTGPDMTSALCESGRHELCPGWWPDPGIGPEAPRGMTCNCDCHDRLGFPGWDRWLRARGLQN